MPLPETKVELRCSLPCYAYEVTSLVDQAARIWAEEHGDGRPRVLLDVVVDRGTGKRFLVVQARELT